MPGLLLGHDTFEGVYAFGDTAKALLSRASGAASGDGWFSAVGAISNLPDQFID